MLRFELDKATATLENVNLRTEKAGQDKIPAADLKITCAQPAGILAHFSPTLRSFLFDEAGPRDLADGPTVRDPHLGYPLKRDEEMTGAVVAIGYGVGAPMRFEEAKVNAFQLTPHDGGSVVLGFRVQCRPTPEQVARLYQLQETGIELSIEPAELPTMKDAA